MLKIGDALEVIDSSLEPVFYKNQRYTISWVGPSLVFRVKELEDTKHDIDWYFTSQFKLLVKCPICGSDPCNCLDDEDLDAKAAVHEEPPKGKPLPAQALTSWPSGPADRMAAARLLNELGDEK